MHLHESYKVLPWDRYYSRRHGLSHLAQQLQRFDPDDQKERCGLLVGIPWATVPISVREVFNTHPLPALHFRIGQTDRDQVAALVAPRRSVVGTIHTHPGRDRDGWYPSSDDLVGVGKHPGLIHLIYHPYTRRLVDYDHRGIRSTFHIR